MKRNATVAEDVPRDALPLQRRKSCVIIFQGSKQKKTAKEELKIDFGKGEDRQFLVGAEWLSYTLLYLNMMQANRNILILPSLPSLAKVKGLYQ